MGTNNISKNLKYLRKKQGLTQLKLRSSLGITRSTWSNYENGLTTPSIEDLIKFSIFFGISLDDLIIHDLGSMNPLPQKLPKKISNSKLNQYSKNDAITIVSEPQIVYLMEEIKKLQQDVNMIKEGRIKT